MIGAALVFVVACALGALLRCWGPPLRGKDVYVGGRLVELLPLSAFGAVRAYPRREPLYDTESFAGALDGVLVRPITTFQNFSAFQGTPAVRDRGAARPKPRRHDRDMPVADVVTAQMQRTYAAYPPARHYGRDLEEAEHARAARLFEWQRVTAIRRQQARAGRWWR